MCNQCLISLKYIMLRSLLYSACTKFATCTLLRTLRHSTPPKQSYTRWRAKAGRPLGRKAGWHLVFDCIGGVEWACFLSGLIGLVVSYTQNAMFRFVQQNLSFVLLAAISRLVGTWKPQASQETTDNTSSDRR